MNRSLAVVVALTEPAKPTLEASLARFAEEAGSTGEVLLVDASGSGEAARLAGRFANVRVITRPVGRLAPTLWRDGLLATDAKLVALTTAQMLPGRGWLEALRDRMQESGAAGVGGPIEPGDGLDATDQAVALLRYANYFPSVSPLPPGEGPGVWDVAPASTFGQADFTRSHALRGNAVLAAPRPIPRRGPNRATQSVADGIPTQSVGTRGMPSLVGTTGRRIDPPGDNALYRRDLLLAVESSWLDGFWEVEVHRALRDRGESLAMSDRAVVAFVGGVGLASMARQRFRHARRYAQGRSSGLGVMARLARVVAVPLVPPLLCFRALRALRARQMPAAAWLPALLPMAWLATAWAIGEGVGTCRPDDRRLEPMTRRIREVA